jgi:hypothetical protein
MRPPAVDLPDPLKQPPPDRKADRGGQGAPNAPIANADDLLAQMAGEEVDRLIAEARVEINPGEVEADPAPARQDAQFRSEPSPSRLAPFTGPEQSRRSRAPRAKAPPPAAPPALLTNPNDLALDDLFKQIGGDMAPLNPAAHPDEPISPSNTDQASPGNSGAALEQSLTARAQELIDRAKWEAVQDGILPAGPEAAADRASFATAAMEKAAPAREKPAPARVAEPPSVAEALAAEMEEDERIHAGVAKLATARDSIEAGKNAGSPSGLNVTGVAVVGVEEIVPGQAPPQPAVKAAESPSAAAGAAAPVEAAMEAVTANAPQIDPAAEEREPLLLRFLEWLNAPLANLSDSARAALGKVAIATTVNALAVLLYVLVFRR